LASNPAFHARTKYIELNYHFVHEKVTAGLINVKFICSQDQVADALTKPLSVAHFKNLWSKLTVNCSTVRLRGPVSTDIQEDTEAIEIVQDDATQEDI
jgi:hypothetical protein